MNRRSFIRSLTTVAAASIFLPRAADAFTWKRRTSGMWVVNPEYITAPYEIRFWHSPGWLFPYLVDRKRPIYNPKPGSILVPEHFPIRKDAAGEYIHSIIWKKST